MAGAKMLFEAGRSGEDRSPTMKRILFYFVIAAGCAVGGYLAGLAQGSNRAVKTSNTASCVFFAGIHHLLAKGDIAEARKLTESAISSHVAVIEAVDLHPIMGLWNNIPGLAKENAERANKALRGLGEYFSEYSEALTPEAKRYLTRFQGGDKSKQ